jgi:DNA polymerase-3 subunit epsilon
MKYLSIDLEATGLEENAYVIEFAAVPVDTSNLTILSSSAFHCYIKCPSFNELKPELNEWVIKHNENLINKANKDGISQEEFKLSFFDYLNSKELQDYRDKQYKNFSILGKSLTSIDIPFLNRYLGWDFMKKEFHHQTLDVSSVARLAIDLQKLPEHCVSGSKLSTFMEMGDVAHTALEDAIATAELYFKLMKLIKN